MNSRHHVRRPVADIQVPSGVRRLAACVLLALIASTFGPNGAHAQAVGGLLLDSETQRPVPGARLFLLDAAGVPLDSTFTNELGRYHLEAPRAGTHFIHFQMDGWAGAGSDSLELKAGVAEDYDFRVTLVSTAAMQQMSAMIHADERLQTSLPEVCGEALRPWEAGLLVGTVRARATNAPLPDVRVAVATDERGVTRSTVANADGIYILCNVPLGSDVSIIATAPDGTREITNVEIRAGMVSWYDLHLGVRR